MESSPFRNSFWKSAANLFIVFHLVILGLWNLPETPTRNRLISRYIESYMYWTGLRQNWAMFAVGGATANYRAEADIVFKDGGKKTWIFPPEARWGALERTQKIMRATWGSYVVDHKEAWADTAHYVARQYAQKQNPPTRVTLLMCTADISPPQKFYQPIVMPSVFPHRQTLFEYTVSAEDLP